ncbi:hypothetical protein ACFVUS_14995 [Nocardia sp. NPDC058058]|uniref:hypothetical protein n=1 Tax=Nocardia sp. NPDC058058 TaxID=3346317 RepID=UPI0036DA3BA9
MKSTLTTAFVIAALGMVIAAPSAQASETKIHTGPLEGAPCHVNQTYQLWLSTITPYKDVIEVTDNGVSIPVHWSDYHISRVDWTPTTIGRHTLTISNDQTEIAATLIQLGSSKLADLGTGSGLFRAPSTSVQTTVVPASDTTTPCLQ